MFWERKRTGEHSGRLGPRHKTRTGSAHSGPWFFWHPTPISSVPIFCSAYQATKRSRPISPSTVVSPLPPINPPPAPPPTGARLLPRYCVEEWGFVRPWIDFLFSLVSNPCLPGRIARSRIAPCRGRVGFVRFFHSVVAELHAA